MAIEQIEKLPDVSFIDDDINLEGIQKQMVQDYKDKYHEISIHVPSWGTTPGSKTFETPTFEFQSTFPRGERLGRKLQQIDCFAFQSTFPRGERRKFSQIFFVFLCNKYNFSTFYYPFSLFFSVIHVTFLIFVVRILPAFYVYF